MEEFLNMFSIPSTQVCVGVFVVWLLCCDANYIMKFTQFIFIIVAFIYRNIDQILVVLHLLASCSKLLSRLSLYKKEKSNSKLLWSLAYVNKNKKKKSYFLLFSKINNYRTNMKKQDNTYVCTYVSHVHTQTIQIHLTVQMIKRLRLSCACRFIVHLVLFSFWLLVRLIKFSWTVQLAVIHLLNPLKLFLELMRYRHR